MMKANGSGSGAARKKRHARQVVKMKIKRGSDSGHAAGRSASHRRVLFVFHFPSQQQQQQKELLFLLLLDLIVH
jgi:hypothetical protein